MVSWTQQSNDLDEKLGQVAVLIFHSVTFQAQERPGANSNLRVVSTLFNTEQESRLDLGHALDNKLHCFYFQEQGKEKQTVFDT